jgi:hypothetical protein
MNFQIIRHAYLRDRTLGRIILPGLTLPTLERPWIKNPAGTGGLPRESCIPDGYYQLRPHHSRKFPDSYILTGETLGVYGYSVPQGQDYGRSAILIHPANKVGELLGCIAPGMTHGMIEGELGVLDSRRAMDKLRAILGREEHYVEIRPTTGTLETP